LTIIAGSAGGEEQKSEKKLLGIRYLKEYGFLSGWQEGSLEEADDYQTIPFILRFGFDLTPLVRRINSPSLMELEVEPFLSPVLGPETNVEGGCNLLLKYAYPLTSRFLPYVESGLGLLYTTQHFEEQSTQLNSILQGGLGFHYFLRKNLSLNVGYRFRHFSNAGIRKPNTGIDTYTILIGFSIFR